MVLKARRLESPSSINTHRQCPRKYHYQYVKKMPTGTSIHLIRGNVVHQALEDFYDVELDDAVTQNFRFLHLRCLKLFTKHWKLAQEKLDSLGMSEDEIKVFFDESVMMMQNWFGRFKKKMLARMEAGEDFRAAYESLRPRREEEYKSEEYMVRGFVDVIHELDGKTVVIDYKTSKKAIISPAYRLQLAIYAMLYEETHGKKPDYVGIDFLKSIEHILPVDEELVKEAQFAIEQHHAATESDDIEDYPQHRTPLCKWRTGQCDFYDLCFGGVSEDEFKMRAEK